MSETVLIKNGRIIDPLLKINETADLLIENGIIKKIGKGVQAGKAQIIDATGCVVSPGFVDLHTHLRQPGREDEETVESASKAAAKGGFTTITAMPNTDPVIDNGSLVKFIKGKAASVPVNVEVAGAITKGLKGESLSVMSEMKEAGAIFFTDDGRAVQSSFLMRLAMEYAGGIGVKLMLHCEEESLVNNGQMNEGFLSTKLGLKGIPREAEEIVIARDLMLAKLTGCQIHITHVSTKGSVDLIRKAKYDGVNVTCDVTPHHFSLMEERLIDYDANFKVNPPLRREDDRTALIDGLIDGTIDAIATDHAPHAGQEKECEFDSAAFGTIGLETALGAAVTFLHKTGSLTLQDIIYKLTAAPSVILGKETSSLKEGVKADLVVFNPKESWKVEKQDIVSKSKNSAFLNMTLYGMVKLTIAGGVIAYEQ